MAIGPGTFQNLGGAVSDLFAGLGATTAADMKAKGIGLQAQGGRLTAESLRLKAGGDIAEATQYDLAAALARKNEDYVTHSTEIQETQINRQIANAGGGIRASAGASGLRESGSVLDVLADSASEGALAKEVLAQQGHIQVEGYEEQAQSYEVMAAAGRTTAAGEQDIASKTEGIAAQTDELAAETQKAGKQAMFGDFIGAALKGAAAVASLIPGVGTVAGAAIGAAGSVLTPETLGTLSSTSPGEL